VCKPDEGGNADCGETASDQPDPGIDAELHLQHRDRIGPGAEIGGMAEGELAAIAAEDVPRLAEQRGVERHDDGGEPAIPR
jgi:hypothetical protein